MNLTLEEQVGLIWDEKEITPPILLSKLEEVVAAWEKLFVGFYENLDSENSRELSNALGSSSRMLKSVGHSAAGIQILVQAWKETGKRQCEVHFKIYRAAIAFYLSELHLQRGDRGAAFWWQLHALADDYLEGSDGGGARIVLKTILGIPDEGLLTSIWKIANVHLKECREVGWNTKHGFAEDVIFEFAIRHAEYASLFAYPTNVTEYPISPAYVGLLLQSLNADKRGMTLEHLACYLFLHIPGCTPAHNLLDSDKMMQTDVVIRNLTTQSNLVAETFGRHFGIECKNWIAPVGSPECGYFLHRLRLLHFKFGVLLAKNGVTGTRKSILREISNSDDKSMEVTIDVDRGDEEAARQMIRRSYHEDGLTCIVIQLEDLERLANEKTTLLGLLIEKIEEFRFGRPYPI
jgi:hypothetical protein